MTRDEHRKACIEAMANKWLRTRGYRPLTTPDWLLRKIIEEQTAAFDSLHGIARVDPIEATEEMLEMASSLDGFWAETWRAMSTAGDLTNPPEGEP